MKIKNGSIYKPDRLDLRTREEFERDIKIGHKIERDIITKYKSILEKEIGAPVQILDNGSDNSGGYLEHSKVTMDADFIVNGKLLEVKYIKPRVSSFHLKKAQIHSYIKQKADVLFVNGYGTSHPTYTIFNMSDLLTITEEAELVEFQVWGGKLAYKIQTQWFNWKNFLTS